jgi:hypothetical protein
MLKVKGNFSDVCQWQNPMHCGTGFPCRSGSEALHTNCFRLVFLSYCTVLYWCASTLGYMMQARSRFELITMHTATVKLGIVVTVG